MAQITEGGKPGNGCKVNPLATAIWKAGSEFISSKEVKNNKDIMDPSGFVKSVYDSVFDMPYEYRNVVPIEPGKVKTFQNRLAEIRRSIQKGELNGRFGEFLYNTSARAKKNPYANKLLNDMVDVNYAYKGRKDRHVRDFGKIVSALKQEAQVDGFLSRGAKDWRAAVKAANRFSKDIEATKLLSDQGDKDAISKLYELREQENLFYAEGEGKIFGDFINTIQDKFPKIAKDLKKELWDKRDKIRAKYELQGMKPNEAWNKAVQAVKTSDFKVKKHLDRLGLSAPMQKAATAYLELMDSMYKTLEQGVNAYVDIMKEGMIAKGMSKDKIDQIGKKILEKAMPNYEEGFYPHYRRDLNIDFMQNLMPHMQKVSDSMSEFLANPTQNKVMMNQAIDSINGYLVTHAKGRDKTVKPDQISRNFLLDVQRYMAEIDNFNYVAHADLKTRQALNQVKKSFKEGGTDGYGHQVVKLIMEMNGAMKGKNTGFENESLENITKSLLAMEFTSKLGLNMRSAVKNSTQWLLNVVEFGPTMMMKAKKFYKENAETGGLYEKMVKARDEAGLEFGEGDLLPEMQEALGTKRDMTKKLILDGNVVRMQDTNPFDKLTDLSSNIAGKAGIFMRGVENKNRRDTFEFGWYKMYDMLSNNTEYINKLKAEGKDVNKEIESRARRYAINMVTLLHFDYSAMSKSKYLRSGVGRLMGQFQHYGFKFLEYNMNLAKNGTNDILAGRVTGPEAMKAYRMGITYFLAPAMLTMLTGIDFGNLLEHDTKNRLEQLGALLVGDEEEKIKAFYGKGPLTTMIGAPVFSDALAIGNIFEFWNMEEDSMLNLIAGYRDYADVSGDRKAYEILRILNTSAGRFAYQTMPLLFSGKLGAAAQFEAGLYPTTKAKEYQKKGKETAEALMPDDLAKAIEMLQQHAAEAKQNPF